MYIWTDRNYQAHVASLIADWTMGEEAKYQAELISEDVEQDMTDIAKAAADSAKANKKSARGKSPKGRKGSGEWGREHGTISEWVRKRLYDSVHVWGENGCLVDSPKDWVKVI